MWKTPPTLLAALTLAASPASAAIRVAVSYTFVEVEVSPRQETHRTPYTIYFTLEGRSVHFQSSNGLVHDGTLGQAHMAATITGDPYRANLKVQGANRLVSTSAYPTYVVRTTITTNGVDACSAVRDVIRKPGHRYLEDTRVSNHEHMLLSDVHFEDVTCSIAAQ